MRFFFLLALCAVLLGGCQTGGADAAGLRLLDVETADDLMAEFDGLGARAVVVNVWATWCGPCIVEFPEFVRYDDAMEGRGVEVRFLSVDDPEIRDRVVAFLEERGWDEPAYLAQSQRVVQGLAMAGNSMWDGSIPISFILVDGKVRDGWIGATTYDLLAARVDRVLAAAPVDETAAR